VYVYILQSINSPKQLYIGKSGDLKKRITSHNQGLTPSTKRYKPWKLLWASWFSHKYLANDFEKYLKTGSGYAFRNKRLIKS
jgi:predicted GIY-YIG superfamily endonuclease